MKLHQLTADEIRALDELEVVGGEVVAKANAEFSAPEMQGFKTSLLESGTAPADHAHIAKIDAQSARDLLMDVEASVVIPSSDTPGHSHEVTWSVVGGEVVASAVDSLPDHTHTPALKAIGGAPAEVVLHKLDATVDPTTEGTTEGYAPNKSIWLNTTSSEAFRFMDDTVGWVQGPSFDLTDLTEAIDAAQLTAGVNASLAKAETAMVTMTTHEVASSAGAYTVLSTIDSIVITMSGVEDFILTLSDVATYSTSIAIIRLGTGTGTLTIETENAETIVDTRVNQEVGSITLDSEGESIELDRLTAKWVTA